ncbi:RYamide receptor isoform X2 [Zootermopsis nevadensis]|uniref:RYamide receptor isoform X2 n=1 Tax=Zootermopsis nevadensis TaxID=136037 RepID=UPI000B8E6322|nr:RYamide receptor isoform X2 [Zootermopsis nevadensis]
MDPNFTFTSNYSYWYNSSFNISCENGPGGVDTSPCYQAAVYIMYCFIFMLALAGNGLVCHVVQSSPRMRTVTNYFIVNLAVGDILMTLFCVPFSSVSTLLLQYWPFGAEMCHTVSYSQAVSVFVSAYTLVAISVDRYMAIMWPLKPRMSKRHAKVIIGVVWLVALGTALPILLLSNLSQPHSWYEECGRFVCEEKWDNPHYRYCYTMMLMVLQYVVPLLVLVFTYTRIAIVVWGKQIPGEAENSRDQRMARSKRKMIKMMVIVVIIFTACWLPFNILMVALDNNSDLASWSGTPYLWFAFHWLAMSHSCYNPVIYCWMNTRFRAGFCTVLDRLPGLRRLFPLNVRHRHSNTSSVTTGVALTDPTESSVLQRVNTCTTYLSTRRKHQYLSNDCASPARSGTALLKGCPPTAHYNGHRRLSRLDSYPEDQI